MARASHVGVEIEAAFVPLFLSDAMTSGGLLIAAEPHEIRAMNAALAPTHTCAIIGRITEDGDGRISVL